MIWFVFGISMTYHLALGLKIMLLFRGVHYGTYVSRNSEVNVFANDERVHLNHQRMLVKPLQAITKDIMIAVCTYQSSKVRKWIARKNATIFHVMNRSVNETKPNELILAAYDLVLSKHFDLLISVRTDLILKQSMNNFQHYLHNNKTIVFPWREMNPHMPVHCFGHRFKERQQAVEDSLCNQEWRKAPRFADAIVIVPRHMVPDLRFAVYSAMTRTHVYADQHSTFQHLLKYRRTKYSIDKNVSTLLLGYWDSNPSRHANPLFSLARQKVRARKETQIPEERNEEG
mmetsp:Transcript_12172/g.14790  ORF Transcript_12172/g.14790 Transcript_12172/m.14790 type:complete len:287 (-) Transcript_12172:263-1123(-)